MWTSITLEVLAILIPTLFVVFYKIGKMQKSSFETLVRIWFTGLIFGFFWETMGTIVFYEIMRTKLWAYPVYHFYFYDGVPLALPFGWAWWFAVCYHAQQSLMKIKTEMTAKILAYYFTGLTFGTLIECLAVAIGWWRYVYPFPKEWCVFLGERFIHVVVFCGWGFLTLFVFSISIDFFNWLSKKYGKKKSYLVLPFVAALTGVLSFATIGLLYILLPWSLP